MQKTVLLIILILSFVTFNMLFAETTKLDKSISIKPLQQTEQIISIHEKNKQDDLYKLLYENSVKSNNEIIGTMQWSIGFVATFIIILLGSQIFFNYKVSKEEIKSIKSNVEEKFANLRAEISEDLNKDSNAYGESMRKSFNTLEKSLQHNFSERFNEKEKYFDIKMDSIEKDNALLKNDLNTKSNDLLIKLERMDGDIWKLKGVEANALVRFIDTAYLEIERGYETKYILNDIIETLKNMTRISTTEYNRLNELMDQIPNENSVIKNKIESVYKELPKYMYVDDPDNSGSVKIVNI